MQTYFAAPPSAPSQFGVPDDRHHCDDAPHIGVVFVHGVGFQEASDTFVGAVGPLIRLIREGGYPEFEPLPDPVVRGGLIPDTSLPYAELAVPTVEPMPPNIGSSRRRGGRRRSARQAWRQCSAGLEVKAESPARRGGWDGDPRPLGIRALLRR